MNDRNRNRNRKKNRRVIRLRVREVAQMKGISMLRLSRSADVSYKVVVGVWRDPFYNISLQTLGKLARALGVPARELIEDVPPDVPP